MKRSLLSTPNPQVLCLNPGLGDHTVSLYFLCRKKCTHLRLNWKKNKSYLQRTCKGWYAMLERDQGYTADGLLTLLKYGTRRTLPRYLQLHSVSRHIWHNLLQYRLQSSLCKLFFNDKKNSEKSVGLFFKADGGTGSYPFLLITTRLWQKSPLLPGASQWSLLAPFVNIFWNDAAGHITRHLPHSNRTPTPELPGTG